MESTLIVHDAEAPIIGSSTANPAGASAPQPLQGQPDQVPEGPPPAYSFLNQNQQAFSFQGNGGEPHAATLKSPEVEELSDIEPPPPYPFLDQRQINQTVRPQQVQPEEPQRDLTSLVHLVGSSNEFSLKFTSPSCCPNFSITPLGSQSGLSLPQTHNKIKCSSSGEGCYSCCMPSSLSWQTITFSKNQNEETLNFIYKPEFCAGSCGKERLVDIYIPERNERIGWIKFNGDFCDGAVIFNALTNELFLTRKIELDQSPLALTIVDSIGLPAAIASATSGVRYRGNTTWNTFRLAVSPLTVRSRDTRAILLVAFAMWVITHKEKTARSRFWTFIICIMIGFGIGFGLPYLLN